MKLFIVFMLTLLAVGACNYNATPIECRDGIFIKTTPECKKYLLWEG